MIDKKELREIYKKKRREYPKIKRKLSSRRICKKLFKLKEFKSARCVAIYMHNFGEVETVRIIKECKKRKKDVAIPMVNKINHTMELSYIGTHFVKGAYGISEPEILSLCPKEKVDIICVPGVLFDANLRRIGFGKGYYDKLLTGMTAHKVGLAFDFQVLSDIPQDEHDIKMDKIITNKKIYQ